MVKVALVSMYSGKNLGVRVLTSILRGHGHEVHAVFFKDDLSRSLAAPLDHPRNYQLLTNFDLLGFGYDVAPWTEREVDLLCGHLAGLDPDVIGFSLMSCFDELIGPLAARVRAACPRSLLVAGGHGPTYRPRHHAALFDAVLVGEGEIAFPEFLAAWPDRKAMFRAPNVGRLDRGGRYRQNGLAPLVDLADVPQPLFHDAGTAVIHDDRLVREDLFANRDYLIMAGRGCVQNCTYCCNGQFKRLYAGARGGARIRRNRPLDPVLEELRQAKARGAAMISFLDEYIVGDSAFIIELFRRYREEIDLPFTAVLHPEQVLGNPAILDAAVEAGMVHATIGVQSGSERVCAEIFRRKTNKRTVMDYAALAKSRGLRLTYHLIFGNPLETEETMAQTRAFMRTVPFDFGRDTVFCFQLTLFPGTPIEAMVREAGAELPPSDTWLRQALLCQAAMAAPGDEAGYRACMEDLQALPTPELAVRARELYYRRLFAAGRPVTSELAYDYYRAILPLVPDRRVLAWGAGGAFAQHKDVLGGREIVCVIDKDPAKHGASAAGVRICGPEALDEHPDMPVFIFSAYRREILGELGKSHPGRRVY
ncbi:MAG: radical SAM protein [Desulfovibrionaceae bacterium]